METFTELNLNQSLMQSITRMQFKIPTPIQAQAIPPALLGKDIFQPEFSDNNHITSILFKLKSKPAALYSALSGFAINGVNMSKLQSFPEKNSFSSYFFLCDIDGHIESPKIKNSLEELGLHCQDMHVLGVYKSDKFRQK